MKHSGNRPSAYVYTPQRYTKSTAHPGPASLPTALLLDHHAFTQVVHRDIRPKIVLPPLSRVNVSTIFPSAEKPLLESDSIDIFLYAIDVFPVDYLSIKIRADGKYRYLNHNFRMLTEQLGVTVRNKTERNCLSDGDNIHHPLIAGIRRTDPHTVSKKIQWIQEEAIDNQDNKHFFLSWKVPVLTVAKEQPMVAIFTRTLALPKL